mmetsp:Transcript_22239/g.55069  ORF Transcript_22239/g.55069 Transcript_22239/m.55069 type:complete len:204 (+) Transcript_22239:93-704(+)
MLYSCVVIKMNCRSPFSPCPLGRLCLLFLSQARCRGEILFQSRCRRKIIERGPGVVAIRRRFCGRCPAPLNGPLDPWRRVGSPIARRGRRHSSVIDATAAGQVVLPSRRLCYRNSSGFLIVVVNLGGPGSCRGSSSPAQFQVASFRPLAYIGRKCFGPRCGGAVSGNLVAVFRSRCNRLPRVCGDNRFRKRRSLWDDFLWLWL